MEQINIIGGGLAGCEAAFQAAKAGHTIRLYEMRPGKTTPAHKTALLGEMICSNSFGSNASTKSSGILFNELRLCGSQLMEIIDDTKIPAGHALAVDREIFAEIITEKIKKHSNIELFIEETTEIPDGLTIIATGPLTSSALAKEIQKYFGIDNLFFYDAIAPIILKESVDFEIAYWGSRFGMGISESGDYINCPFTKDEYLKFTTELSQAERVPLKNFELSDNKQNITGKTDFFEACLPIEVMAERGLYSLAFGPLRPVGLRNPKTDNMPFAVAQLRQDDVIGDFFNLVGFQTNLKFPEQKRVFRMIPGLRRAEFIRFGQLHRNTYVNSPKILYPTMQTKIRSDLFLAGQITGMEGYATSIASGLIAGINASRFLDGKPLIRFPDETLIGALAAYISDPHLKTFQPMKANFGLLPSLDEEIKNKKIKGQAYYDRSMKSLGHFNKSHEIF